MAGGGRMHVAKLGTNEAACGARDGDVVPIEDALGQFMDDPERLRAAAAHLERHGS